MQNKVKSRILAAAIVLVRTENLLGMQSPFRNVQNLNLHIRLHMIFGRWDPPDHLNPKKLIPLSRL